MVGIFQISIRPVSKDSIWAIYYLIKFVSEKAIFQLIRFFHVIAKLYVDWVKVHGKKTVSYPMEYFRYQKTCV